MLKVDVFLHFFLLTFCVNHTWCYTNSIVFFAATDSPYLSKPNSASSSLSPSILSFTEVSVGRGTHFQVGPYSHWIVQMRQKGPSLVRFNYSLPLAARLGVFGRRNLLPTHTRYNFLEILTADSGKSLRTEKVRILLLLLVICMHSNNTEWAS